MVDFIFPLCSAPRGPDGQILYDPYEHTKEICLIIGAVSIAFLAVQLFLAWRLRGRWIFPGIGAIILLLHPAWTLRAATDLRNGDCGFLQLIGSYGFLLGHTVALIVQIALLFWFRNTDEET